MTLGQDTSSLAGHDADLLASSGFSSRSSLKTSP
jgi:hypothetical protein